VVIKNEQILDAAAEVLAKRPDATLQSIAKAAGISRTTIFHRYPARDDLLEALGQDTLASIGVVMARVPNSEVGDVAAVMSEVTRGLMPLGPRTVFLRVVPGWGNGLDEHWESAVTPLAVYIHQAQAIGMLRTDQPARWLTASYIGLLFAAWDEIAEGELGTAQAARLVTETWLTGSGYSATETAP
jgi:AcrR family transcriptional regulator